MPITLESIDKRKVAFFRYRQRNGLFLLTNDSGAHAFLKPLEFEAYLSGRLKQTLPEKYIELRDSGFIRNDLDFDALSLSYAQKNAFLGKGPSLHIVVVSLRCDHACVYCQSGSRALGSDGFDMTPITAKKVIDLIFESPSKSITIEFQGGEPLANFDTLRCIVQYARQKNRQKKKKLSLSLVTNLSLMTKKRLQFLINEGVGICTSLDGPEFLHNRNRKCAGRNSHKNTLRWIKEINKKFESGAYKYKLNALTTVTRHSLKYPIEIVNEFIRLGFNGIYLRPVNPFGINGRKGWSGISFHADEFLKFYVRALEHIIELNNKGVYVYERTALMFLYKILTRNDPNHLDVRSPCGAGISQVAYNFNGDIYTCDEARMLFMNGDDAFKLGNVRDMSYAKLIDNEVVKTMCVASCLDCLPGCSMCAYKPYCGVCPIYNYVTDGNLFSVSANNERCKIHMGILDYLFDKLQNGGTREILHSWIPKSKWR